MHSILELALILLATAVFVVVVFRQLRLPALIGIVTSPDRPIADHPIHLSPSTR